jgi:hypothetical protein
MENDQSLTLRDAKVFYHHNMQDKTMKETAKILNVSIDTVKRTKKKEAYYKLAAAQLEQQTCDIPTYVAKLIAKTEAKKANNYGGNRVEEDDNVAQMTALKEIGAIYGVYAPKEVHAEFSLAQASDAELFGEIEEAQRRVGVEAEEHVCDSGDGESLEGEVLPV